MPITPSELKFQILESDKTKRVNCDKSYVTYTSDQKFKQSGLNFLQFITDVHNILNASKSHL